MRKLVVVLGVLVIAAGTTGCVSLAKSYPINTTPGGIRVMPLERSQYKVLGDTEGTACVQYLLGARLPWFSTEPVKSLDAWADTNKGGGGMLDSIPLIGALFGANRPALDLAIYDALEKMEGADSLISVRITSKKNYKFLFLYSEECCTIKGKAFQIKIDAQ